MATSLGVPCIVGRNSKGTGATGGLELYGTNNNMNGSHIQAFVNTSVYPVFQQLNWGQDNIALSFDSYYDGTNWKSSDTGSNFQIYKISDKLAFNYKSGVALAGNIAWSEAMNISNAGTIATTGAITASSLITANAGISSAQTITMTNSGSQIYFSDGTTATCGIRWLDDNHGVFCQRNANQMFIREYGDIHFQTSGSTWRAQMNSNGLYVPSQGFSTSVQVFTRTGFPNEPMILMRSANMLISAVSVVLVVIIYMLRAPQIQMESLREITITNRQTVLGHTHLIGD